MEAYAVCFTAIFMITRAFRGYYHGDKACGAAKPFPKVLHGLGKKKEELDKLRVGKHDLRDELAFYEIPRIPVTIIKNHDR